MARFTAQLVYHLVENLLSLQIWVWEIFYGLHCKASNGRNMQLYLKDYDCNRWYIFLAFATVNSLVQLADLECHAILFVLSLNAKQLINGL